MFVFVLSDVLSPLGVYSSLDRPSEIPATATPWQPTSQRYVGCEPNNPNWLAKLKDGDIVQAYADDHNRMFYYLVAFKVKE